MSTITPRDLERWLKCMPEENKDLPIYVSKTCWPESHEKKEIIMKGIYGHKGKSSFLFIIE